MKSIKKLVSVLLLSMTLTSVVMAGDYTYVLPTSIDISPCGDYSYELPN